MTRLRWIALPLVLLAGCASSPQNNYYTLSAESACAATSPAAHLDVLRPKTIRLPALLDRQELVVRTGPQTVDIREFDRWAEPLDQMATRILTEDLERCESAASSAESNWSLSISVDEFIADTSGHAYLSGRWWIYRNAQEMAGQPEHEFSFTEKTDGVSGTESAAAMSALLRQLADDIVSKLSHKESPAKSNL